VKKYFRGGSYSKGIVSIYVGPGEEPRNQGGSYLQVMLTEKLNVF